MAQLKLFLMSSTDIKKLHKAFKILRRNYGAPGRDRISIREVKSKYKFFSALIESQINSNEYFFTKPISREFVDYSGKRRLIYIYTVLDRWVQHYLKLEISPHIHSFLKPYIFGYIRRRSNIQAAEYILHNNPRYVLKLDISNFSSSIDIQRIFKSFQVLNVDETILDLVINSFAHNSNKGLPPGHVLSPLFSNFYLRDFDSMFPVNYARFSDDLIFGLESKSQQETIISKVSIMLDKIGLKLNVKKTKLFTKPSVDELL